MYKVPLMVNSIGIFDKLALAKFILTTNKFTKGKLVKQFEAAWSRWQNCKYSIFVNSGSSANLILVEALKIKYGLKRGDKVLLPACTWSTNVSPIIQAGLTPVFCDINLNDYSFKIDHAKKLKKVHDIKAVFVTHLLGLPAPMAQLKRIFRDSIFIEDCCESHGAVIDGKKVGNHSEGSTFSFYFAHHMTTIEGGMVCTNDKELRDLMLLQRSHGMARELDPVDFKAAAHQHSNVDPKFLFLTTGYNVRSTEINAFIGLRQIKRLDSYIETRQQMYCEFIERLSVYTDYFHVPSTMGNSSFALPLICKSASVYNALKANLELHSVETRPIVGSNLLRQPFLSEYGEGKYANADILHYSGLYIGNNQGMSSKKLDYIFTAIDEII